MHSLKLREFGIKRENEERRDGGCGIVLDPQTQKFAVGMQNDGVYRLFSGGVDEDEDVQEGILREVREESGLHDFHYVEKIAEAMTHYRNSLKNVNRLAHATCYLIILQSRSLVQAKKEEHEKFELEWVNAEELIKNWENHNQNHDYDHWLYFFKEALLKAKALGYYK